MKKGKIIFAVITAAVCTVGITVSLLVICKKLFERNYITISE